MSALKYSVTKLGEDNYEEWRVAVRAALRYDGLWDVCVGRKVLADFTDKLAFTREKEKALSMITLFIDSSQYGLIGDEEDPQIVWDKLEKTHRARGFGSRFKMLRIFLSMKMDNHQSMVSRINSIDSYAARLKAIKVEISDEMIIIALVNGLPDTFDPFTISLDSVASDALTLEYVKGRLLNEHTRQAGPSNPPKVKEEPDHEENRFAMAARYKDYQARNPSPVSSDVKQKGTSITCHRCQQKGHFASDCRTLMEGDKPVIAGVANSAWHPATGNDEGNAEEFAF
jgi:hypothetical protein